MITEITPLKRLKGPGVTRFRLLSRQWDITRAVHEILNRPNQNVDGWLPIRPYYEALGGFINIDKARAMTSEIDLSVPIILGVADYDPDDGSFYHVPIDGWHRMHKALELGYEELPFYKLTPQESLESEISGYPRRVRRKFNFKLKRKSTSKKYLSL